MSFFPPFIFISWRLITLHVLCLDVQKSKCLSFFCFFKVILVVLYISINLKNNSLLHMSLLNWDCIVSIVDQFRETYHFCNNGGLVVIESESESCSVVSNSLGPHGLSMKFSRLEYWSG